MTTCWTVDAGGIGFKKDLKAKPLLYAGSGPDNQSGGTVNRRLLHYFHYYSRLSFRRRVLARNRQPSDPDKFALMLGYRPQRALVRRYPLRCQQLFHFLIRFAV